MSILFAGTNIYDFIGDLNINSSNLSAYTAPHVRRSFAPINGRYLRTHRIPFSDHWIRAYFFNTTIYTSIPFLKLVDDDNNAVFDLIFVTGSKIAIRAYDGSSMSVLATSELSVSDSTKYKFDLHIKLDGEDGEISVYLDDVLFVSFVGNTLLSSSPSAIEFGSNITSTSPRVYWSAIFVADEDTRRMVMVENYPTADGTNSDWTGSYSDINEDGQPKDEGFIASEDEDAVSTFVAANIPSNLSSGYDVAAVVLSARGYQKAGSDVKGAIHLGGTTYEVGSFGLGEDMGPGQVILHENPATESAWAISDVNDAEIGVKLKAAT